MKDLLLDIMEKCSVYKACGAVAAYIPELSKADPEELGICIADGSGTVCGVGDFEKRFTMQSIVKPVILLLALMDKGMERVRSLVGVESTGKPFDSFNYSDLALTGDHINPMVNTGAIALCSLLPGEGYGEKFDNLISLVRRLAKNADIEMDTETYLSESATGNKNRALAYLLKAYGLIECDAEGIVDLYFRACSIAVSCKDLSRIALVFANHGYDSETGEQIFPIEYAQYVNAMLTICGMYDGSGEFALNVGVPAKSGVGGGIMAIVPSRIGIGVYSPALDKKGNSYAGIKVMEMLSKTLGLGIF